jgi:hypothetical protein
MTALLLNASSRTTLSMGSGYKYCRLDGSTQVCVGVGVGVRVRVRVRRLGLGLGLGWGSGYKYCRLGSTGITPRWTVLSKPHTITITITITICW